MPKAKNPKMGRPVLNKHKVPVKQWNKWSNLAKKVFNDMMESMRPSMQWAFLHPSAQLMPIKLWHTTRWNASWAAADIVDGEGAISNIIEVMYDKHVSKTANDFSKKAPRSAPKKAPSRQPPKPAPNLGLPKLKH